MNSGPNGSHLNRLLIHQPIDPAAQALRTDIQRMIELEGIWIGGDTLHPEVTVPLASIAGKVYAMKRDQELDPSRFLPTLTLAGPFTAEKPDVEPWVPCSGAKPEPLTLVLLLFPGGVQRVGQWNPAAQKFTPPRIDRFFRVAPTHWQMLPSGPGGEMPAKGGGE